jgi:hypothetical protein
MYNWTIQHLFRTIRAMDQLIDPKMPAKTDLFRDGNSLGGCHPLELVVLLNSNPKAAAEP